MSRVPMATILLEEQANGLSTMTRQVEFHTGTIQLWRDFMTDPNGGGEDQVGYAEGYGSDYAEGAQGYDTGGDEGNYTEY